MSAFAHIKTWIDIEGDIHTGFSFPTFHCLIVSTPFPAFGCEGKIYGLGDEIPFSCLASRNPNVPSQLGSTDANKLIVGLNKDSEEYNLKNQISVYLIMVLQLFNPTRAYFINEAGILNISGSLFRRSKTEPKHDGVKSNFLQRILKDLEADLLTINLVPIQMPGVDQPITNLPYAPDKVLRYAIEHCDSVNDCVDANFELDCTHFVSHCLYAGGLTVSLLDPRSVTVKCATGLCINVNELFMAFSNAADTYPNVFRIRVDEAGRGDFCFIPKWFRLRQGHVMILASKPDSDGCQVFAHTNFRCGERADFEADECVYFRITVI